MNIEHNAKRVIINWHRTIHGSQLTARQAHRLADRNPFLSFYEFIGAELYGCYEALVNVHIVYELKDTTYSLSCCIYVPLRFVIEMRLHI